MIAQLTQEIFRPAFKYWNLFPSLALYKPFVQFHIEDEKYIVRTAKSLSDLKQLFRLRYECFFNREKMQKKMSKLDFDSYDFRFDHILIINKETNRIIGTYRVNSSLNNEQSNNSFYSETEFNIDDFLKTDGNKLELGRACIHPDYRNGATIDLLWKGLTRYAKLTNTRYFFGCSSVNSLSNSESLALLKYFEKNDKLGKDFEISAFTQMSNSCINEEEHTDIRKKCPSLLRSYLSAGAKVYGQPLWDKDFDCVDYFTILDLTNMSPAFARRYMK